MCICMTSPSSLDMRAISISMCAVKRAASSAVACPPQRALEERLGGGLIQRLRVCGQGGVVGRGRAHAAEEVAPLFKRLDVAAVIMHGDAGRGGQQVDVVAPVFVDVDDRVGAESRDDAPAPARLADGDMLRQAVGGGVCCGENLDVETLVQGARAEGGAVQFGGDRVINRHGVFAVELQRDAEDIRQFIADPDARRRGAEETPVVADQLPDGAVVAGGGDFLPPTRRGDRGGFCRRRGGPRGVLSQTGGPRGGLAAGRGDRGGAMAVCQATPTRCPANATCEKHSGQG